MQKPLNAQRRSHSQASDNTNHVQVMCKSGFLQDMDPQMHSTANRTARRRPKDLDQFATSKILSAILPPHILLDIVKVCAELESDNDS